MFFYVLSKTSLLKLILQKQRNIKTFLASLVFARFSVKALETGKNPVVW